MSWRKDDDGIVPLSPDHNIPLSHCCCYCSIVKSQAWEWNDLSLGTLIWKSVNFHYFIRMISLCLYHLLITTNPISPTKNNNKPRQWDLDPQTTRSTVLQSLLHARWNNLHCESFCHSRIAVLLYLPQFSVTRRAHEHINAILFSLPTLTPSPLLNIIQRLHNPPTSSIVSKP